MNLDFNPQPDGIVLAIGSAGTDIVGRVQASIETGTSNPGRLRYSLGGVARNVSENLARLGTEVRLLTAVGDDPRGRRLLETTSEAGVDVSAALIVPEQVTGTYIAVLDPFGNLHLGLDDMRVSAAITPRLLRQHRALFREAAIVFIDANLPPDTLATAIELARRARVPVAADPTSVALSKNLTPFLEDLWLVTPNEAEAEMLCPHPVPHADIGMALQAARHLVSHGVDIAIITMAEFGVSYATADSSGHLPAVQTEFVDPTGASDALTASVIFGLMNGIPLDESVRLGLSAAAYTLSVSGSVAKDLSLELLYDQLR